MKSLEQKIIVRCKNCGWGDIYYCDLGVTNGSVQSGMRPVLVVQTNRLNESSPTVVVAAITAVGCMCRNM